MKCNLRWEDARDVGEAVRERKGENRKTENMMKSRSEGAVASIFRTEE
jgi:hypothetical protein